MLENESTRELTDDELIAKNTTYPTAWSAPDNPNFDQPFNGCLLTASAVFKRLRKDQDKMSKELSEICENIDIGAENFRANLLSLL